MEILEPFCRGIPAIDPALPDLNDRAKRAIFWRKITGVSIHSALEPHTIIAAISDENRVGIDDSYYSWIERTKSKRKKVDDASFDRLMDALDEFFSEETEIRAIKFLLGEDAFSSFWFSLSRPSMCLAFDKPDELDRLKPLIDLWSRNNWPVAIDGSGRLQVHALPPTH